MVRRGRVRVVAARAVCTALAAVATAVPAAPASEVIATASLRLQRVIRYEGQDRGPARVAVDGLVEACNGIRRSLYELPPVAPPAEALARLDRITVEKFYSGDRAATYLTSTGLDLVDMKRWSTAAHGAGKPELPPDCAKHELKQDRSGTLWRDGRRIQLRFATRRAMVQAAPQDFTALPLPGASDALPVRSVSGESCRDVVAPALVEFAAGKACLWAAFPLATRLNLPWALEAERTFGMPGKTVETDTLVDLQRNPALDPALFEVPGDFTVTGR